MPDIDFSGDAKVKIGPVSIQFSVPKGSPAPQGDPAARLARLRDEEASLRQRLQEVQAELRGLTD